MTGVSRNILIGGAAGQGLATIGQALGKALVRKGYHLHVTQTYESRIRGGHNTFALRAGTVAADAPVESIDLLLALNASELPLHQPNLAPDAFVVSGEDVPATSPRHLRIPIAELAQGVHENTLFLGVVACLLGLTKEGAASALHHFLGKLDPKVAEANEQALERSYAWTASHKPDFAPLPPPGLPEGSRIMIHGNEAIAMGAMAAGLKLCCFYPMSPGTSIPLTVAGAAERMGIVVEQVEDEIAAVNMAFGAFYAGAPALAATSGGGFSLMAEGVSLAGVAENPLVLAVAMRPGPATGLATRTEQADLDAALYYGHGEFPRAVLAPGSIQECFDLTRRAFELAERYQTPVIILTDQYLADSFRGNEPFAFTPPATPDWKALPDDPAYERYVMTEDGISPRRLPGFGKALVVCDSHEHTPDGHVTEDLPLRARMQAKRMAKLRGMAAEAIPPAFSGPENPDILLLCWGSSSGAVEEAASTLRGQGVKAGVCHFTQLWPLRPESFVPRLRAAKETVMVESNYTGQLAGLLRREAGFSVHRMVTRFDGLPLTSAYILNQLKSR